MAISSHVSSTTHLFFRKAAPSSGGFALISTLTLLVLLTVIAVGLLSLSSVSLRKGTASSAQAEARANARFALVVAIGELQKQVGPDRRVTATATILDKDPESPDVDGVKHPHWTGVWNSWTASEEAFGDDEPSDHRTIQAPNNSRLNTRPGMSPSYAEHREDHFRGWLVSLGEEEATSLEAARSVEIEGVAQPDGESKAVRIVGEGSLGNGSSSDFVSVPLLEVAEDSGPNGKRAGRYGWWVADESSKARIMSDHWESTDDDLSKSELIGRTLSAGSPGHEVLPGLEGIDDSDRLDRAISRNSLELAPTSPTDAAIIRELYHDITPWSRGILTDVREGGLKQDLNALLERPIKLREPMHRSSEEDLLYAFDTQGQESVPIQDLAAYYQSYREIVKFNNSRSGNPLASNALQVNNIDFGSRSRNPDLGSRFDFTREYTNIYRMPIPIRVQFMLSYIAVPRTAADRRAQPGNRDTHKLHIGITPSLTFWNPFNVPLVMNAGTERSTQLRSFNIPFGMTWTKGRWSSPAPNDLVWIANRNQEGGDRDTGFTLYVGGQRPVVFEPGEVRIFSPKKGQLASNSELRNSNVWRSYLESHPGWDPRAYLELTRSERSSNRSFVQIEHPNGTGKRAGGGALTFKAGDNISLRLDSAGSRQMANGAALHFFIRQSNTMGGGMEQGIDRSHMRRQYQLTSRLHTESQTQAGSNTFNKELMRGLFPKGKEQITLNVPVNTIIRGEPQAFLVVTLAASCEMSEDNAGTYRGRRTVARPFLHSTPVRSVSFIDRADRDAAYHHGWNWWVEPINSEDEVGAVSSNNRNSFFGGGYTADYGTPYCIQQEIPLAPAQSIAALSHATLSGYSLADRILGSNASARTSKRVGNYTDNPFANATATGGSGLFPRVAQAIGNSYAHPYVPADAAFTKWTRHFNVTDGPKQVTLADHSYLANKALWDEYYFSSITSRDANQLRALATKARDRDASKIWDDLPRDLRITAKELARDFLFKDSKLPNPRFLSYRGDLKEEELDRFFDGDVLNPDGAEQLSAHLLVDGPFNVNSTSTKAWKALFASMRNNEVLVQRPPRQAGATRLASWPGSHKMVETEGTAVSSFGVTSGEPWEGSSDDPSDPAQWNSWRSLTDAQLDELADAMVEQVKRRGPFLSLSEFVNRRLDSRDTTLALKGALQAALDDEDVSINSGFRSADRSFSDEETKTLGGVSFPEALKGPIAYGSAAYVDQADILRHFGGQLTPRGDCFVIRTYGDSLARDGSVRARAWCEAVVQRFPEYLNPTESDAAHVKFDLLQSDSNRLFGRALRVISFRWLSPEEV